MNWPAPRPMSQTHELVSCLMPTADRRPFIPLAIDYFLRQDHGAKELIILDDGQDSVADLVPDHPSLRYVRLDQRLSLGAKLNLGCELARGELIAHWDDDDWYAPWRLSYQLQALRSGPWELCGHNDLFYYDLRDGRAYRYVYPPGRAWMLGSSLFYAKALWRRNRFAEIQVGMDGLFVRRTPRSVMKTLDRPDIAVHLIHGHNVSPKSPDQAPWRPHEAEAVRRLMGPDWATYQGWRAREHQARVARLGRSPARNVFACLVHEKIECVADLVDNLQTHDPTSRIVLYDGGPGLELAAEPALRRAGVEIHPAPRPQAWGRLHGFALDVMRLALAGPAFDTLTIVDSDQLLLQPGYSQALAAALSGRPGLGLLGNADQRHTATTAEPAPGHAWREIDLWRSWLDGFADGEAQFAHWAFWPGTVFTAAACRALVDRFDNDARLRDILAQSQIVATEEVVFPTILKLLGFEVARAPWSHDLVKYRAAFAPGDVARGLDRGEAFFIHPVRRELDDRLRRWIRQDLTAPVERSRSQPRTAAG